MPVFTDGLVPGEELPKEISQHDVNRAARLVIKVSGKRAQRQAKDHAMSLRDEDYLEAAVIWEYVAAAIERLEANT